MINRDAETVFAYHEQTKHHFHRYARSAGYMDWHNQPNPFRSWESVPAVALPLMKRDPDTLFSDLYTPAARPQAAISLERLGCFLELSLAISAWKAVGASRWSLRINPSSGNLHPTEGHLILPAVQGLESGVYHYSPFNHTLEQRAVLPPEVWQAVRSHFGCDGFLVALTSIFWRESWKYGERAYRYCNLDIGHALAALAFAARMNDWQLSVLDGAADGQIETLLGFNRVQWPSPFEEEAVDLICWVRTKAVAGEMPRNIPGFLSETINGLSFRGKPNALSREPVDWAIIYRAHNAAKKKTGGTLAARPVPMPVVMKPARGETAASVIRRRRSAVQYDPRKKIDAKTLFAILDRTRPRRGGIPFDIGMQTCSVDLLVFVHRVEGLASGLYLLARADDRIPLLRRALERPFEWQTAHPEIPFFLLRTGDVSAQAMETSCHQDIAGQSVFAVSMLACFSEPIKKAPYRYRQLHWECGMIGQVLYLEAEAQGIRGTGIGCFFDDAVHDLIGLTDNRFQCLYHFTVGHPVEDDRLTTLPPYHHLKPSGA